MRLITIIGQSGAGKDTVALMLSAILGYDVLCSYTTRPMREGETEGKEHHFVKACNVPESEMLAYTQYGNYEYWTEKKQVNGTAIYVIDEKGLLKLMERCPKAKIITIYVSAKPDTLKKRGISEERTDRDQYRIKFDFNSYDYVIPNNRSMFHLWDYVSFVAKKIREQELGIPNHSVSKQ